MSCGFTTLQFRKAAARTVIINWQILSQSLDGHKLKLRETNCQGFVLQKIAGLSYELHTFVAFFVFTCKSQSPWLLYSKQLRVNRTNP